MTAPSTMVQLVHIGISIGVLSRCGSLAIPADLVSKADLAQMFHRVERRSVTLCTLLIFH